MRHSIGVIAGVFGFGLLWLTPVTFTSVGPVVGLLVLATALVLLLLGAWLVRRYQPSPTSFQPSSSGSDFSHIERHAHHTHL